MKLEKAYGLFEDLLLKHSVERPPFSIAVFSYTDTKAINTHFVNTYFRHLKMYQYVFGTINELHLLPSSSVAHKLIPEAVMSLDDATEMTDLNVVAPSASSSTPFPGPPEGSEAQLQEKEQAEEDARANATTPAPQMAIDIPKLPPLQQVLKSQEDQDMFERALTYELVKIQKELNAKLTEQQDAFNVRMADLETVATPSARGKAAAKKK